jgi:endonuclease/exonuclease/phosphatase family metal-dependent hydrolase
MIALNPVPEHRWRLATLNMLKGGGRRIAPEQALRDTRADLLLLQEAAGFSECASRHVWQRVRARPWGSAVLVARGRLEPIAVAGFEGWVVGAHWGALQRGGSGDGIGVFSVHAPHGEGGYSRRMHHILDAIARACRAMGLREVVIGGDFNICVNPRSHTGEPVRARDRAVQQRLHDEFDLINVWDSMHPRMQPVQTLRWSGNAGVPYHCDGLFVPRDWSAALRRCVVLSSQRWRERSDHNPVVATFAHAADVLAPAGELGPRLESRARPMAMAA